MLQNIAAALAPSLLAGGLLLIPLVGCSESSSVPAPMADGGIQTDAARDSEVRAANGDWAIWCPNGEINCVPSGPIRIDAGDDVQVMCSGTRSFVGYEFDASVSVELDGVRSGFSASNVVVPLNGVLATSGNMSFQHGGVDYGVAELGSGPDRCQITASLDEDATENPELTLAIRCNEVSALNSDDRRTFASAADAGQVATITLTNCDGL